MPESTGAAVARPAVAGFSLRFARAGWLRLCGFYGVVALLHIIGWTLSV